MNRILLALCLVACAKTTPAPGGLGEPCVANGDCATGFLCAAARCVLPANLGGCEPGRLRCNGSDVEKCDANGLGWSTQDSCATGCSAGACKPQVCTPGARRCDGTAAEQCTPAGDTWALVQVCPSLCSADTGTCKAPICTPFSSRCDPAGDTTLSQVCDSYGASWTDVPCGTGKVCDTGRCLDVVCNAGDTRCSANGGSVETCNTLRDGWTPTQTCSIRCGSTGSVAACLQPVCDSGATRCDGSALEQCLPDRSAWAFVTFCATGCQSTGASSAQCAAPVCAPLSRRCASDGGSVQTCSADGTGWVATDTCPQGCAAGQCVTSSAGCSPGDLRCNGVDAQTCAQVSAGVTQWQTAATCLGGCSSGACLPGGSCTGVVLHAGAPSSAADGVSTLLVYSDVIVGADGIAIPDGAEFTVAATAGTVTSTDADAAMPGSQVRSSGGRVHFTVKAPAASSDTPATFTAALSAGTSCGASLTYTWSGAASQTVLVAEDFTSGAARNLAVANPADWDTADAALIARWPADVGRGEDGALSVPSGTFNLSTSGYAPAYGVLGLAGNVATVDNTASGLSGGDEVILWDVQGSSSGTSNAGTYELLHVDHTQGTQVWFVETPAGNYGAANDDDVAVQKVVLQRVPHLSSLSVASGAALTANAWDGTKGGLIFVRVSGTANVRGEVKLDGGGFRAGFSSPYYGEDPSGPSALGGWGAGGYQSGASYASSGGGSYAGLTYGYALLGKLHLGAGGGGNGAVSGGRGGGAIVLYANEVDLADAGAAQQGRIHADGQQGGSGGGGGAGGSVWVSAQKFVFGTGAGSGVTANGGAANGAGAAGGTGRVRIDYLSSDVGAWPACSRLTATCAFGVAGPFVGQSLDEYVLSAAQINAGQSITAADLLVSLGTAQYFASATTSDAPDFGALASNHVTFLSGSSPAQGTRFRWKALLSPAPGAPQAIYGLQWAVTVK